MTHDDLLRFISEDLRIETQSLAPDSPLFSSGVIDSFSLVSLLVHIEQTCGFQIGPADVNLDNFDSLGNIMAYVTRRLGSPSAD